MTTHANEHTEPAYMTVDAYLKADTLVRHGVERHASNQQPCVWVRVGRFPANVALYFATLADIDRFAKALADMRQDLAEAQGYLPNGEPCEYADLFGCPLWDEHDHDDCLEHAEQQAVNKATSKAAEQLPLPHATNTTNPANGTEVPR